MQQNAGTPLIVCFGDSLTAGFQSPAFDRPAGKETPYGAFLRQRLGTRARVAVSGICGERTGEMRLRFRQDVLAHAPTWVVILGGTNDLGWNEPPDMIMRHLADMYRAASDHGIHPVAVTVPSMRADRDLADAPPAPSDHLALEARRWIDDHLARRRVLNGLIKDHCIRQTIACLDLFTETAEPGSQLLAAAYSNDGLHLTTLGYQRFAALLYERIFAPALEEPRRGVNLP